MPPRRRLRAGKGAKATILTRYIKPKQIEVPSKDHRSEIILTDRFDDEKGKVCYQFRLAPGAGHLNNDSLLYASPRYVKIEEEGDEESFFDDVGEGEDGKIKWVDSEARRLLYEDIIAGEVPLFKRDPETNELTTPTAEEIYVMRAEYAAYDFQKFPNRLEAIRKIIQEADKRADKDQEAFEKFVANHPVAHFTRKGHIQWQGSQSQKYALQDIENNIHQEQGFRYMYESRPEYYEEFDFKSFSEKIRQEIKSAKYLHTLDAKGKRHKAS